MSDRVLFLKPWEAVAYAKGIKSQFCRMVKPQPNTLLNDKLLRWVNNGVTWELWGNCIGLPDDVIFEAVCPYGQSGDRIVGKESWCRKVGDDDRFVYNAEGNLDTTCCLYRADGVHVVKVDGDGYQEFNKDGSEASPWRSAVTMPVWASRCTLTVKAVRLVRCQEMTEEDARKQGVEPANCGMDYPEGPGFNYIVAFGEQFELDHGPGLWTANPWVWIIDTERGGK